MAKTCNVALIGQGFMGRTHSNAYLKVAKFFNDLPRDPVMHTVFGMPAEKLEVSDYGFVPISRQETSPTDDRLRIGFVGTLVWHKGAHILVEAIRRLPRDRVDVRVFGSLDTFPDYAAKLQEAAADLPIRFEGGFEPGRAAEIYSRLDLVCICSLWPEKFSIAHRREQYSPISAVASGLTS